MAKQPQVWGFNDKSDAETLKQVARERRVDPRLFTGGVVPKLPGSSHRYVRFVNESGEVIPPRALMAVIGTTIIQGLEYFRVEKPGTTFRKKHLVNSHLEVAAESGSHGIGFDRGQVRVLFDDADTPGNDEGWGPKVDSWEAGKGQPCCLLAHGEYEEGSGSPLLLGTLSPIGTLLCKATANLTAGSVSSNYQIWSGTIAGGANSGFTSLPTIEIQADYQIQSGDFFVAHWVNNGWVSAETVPLTEITVLTAWRVDTGTMKFQYKSRTAKVVAPGTESDWTDAHTGVEC